MARQERDAHINEVAALRARLAAAEAELAKLRPLDAKYIEELERGCEERDYWEKKYVENARRDAALAERDALKEELSVLRPLAEAALRIRASRWNTPESVAAFDAARKLYRAFKRKEQG